MNNSLLNKVLSEYTVLHDINKVLSEYTLFISCNTVFSTIILLFRRDGNEGVWISTYCYYGRKL